MNGKIWVLGDAVVDLLPDGAIITSLIEIKLRR